jgi:FMN phosphatase YigB (HAD superfamily)
MNSMVRKLSIYLPLVLILVLLACSLSNPKFKEISSIQEVKAVFEQATANDLFVFDVDNVLFEPEDPTLQSRFHKNIEFKKILDDFRAFIKTKENAEKYDALIFSKFMLKAKIKPIEIALINNILTMQKRNVKVIALTALDSGKFGVLDSLEEWRYKQLLSFGLDFRSSFTLQNLKFDELAQTEYAAKYKAEKRKYPGRAVFYKGILCSTGSSYSKGIVLKAFLEKIGWKPARIFFFDDSPKNVESVAQEMKDLNIPCKAFIYNAATVNRSANDLDIEVARLKFELIKQRDDYVSYSEAKRLFEQQNNNRKKQMPSVQAAS